MKVRQSLQFKKSLDLSIVDQFVGLFASEKKMLLFSVFIRKCKVASAHMDFGFTQTKVSPQQVTF
jgi:hypothetical protein